jgi:ankyrin repeat protein
MTDMSHQQQLLTAARRGDLHAVDSLLDVGVDPDPLDEHGHTPLAIAVIYGHERVASRLIAGGADPGLRDEAGNTILMDAAAFPRPEIVRLLIDAGANVNAVADDGRTALLNAIWSDDSTPEVAAALIHSGAEVHITDQNYGLSPRQWADKTGKLEVSQLIADAE